MAAIARYINRIVDQEAMESFKGLAKRAEEMAQFVVCKVNAQPVISESGLIEQECQRFQQVALLANIHGQKLLKDQKLSGKSGEETLELVERQISQLKQVESMISHYSCEISNQIARGSRSRNFEAKHPLASVFIEVRKAEAAVAEARRALEQLVAAAQNPAQV